MSNIRYIKDFYGDTDIQQELLEDSIVLFSLNISGNFVRHFKRKMTKKEIDNIAKFFYNRLMIDNDIEIEWDQTS